MNFTQNSSLRDALIADGYARISGIFTNKELKDLKNETLKLIQQWSQGAIKNTDYWNYTDDVNESILYRIHNFENHYPKIKNVIENPKFKNLVRNVFGGDASPRVFALIIKMNGKGASVPWHRDIDKIDFSKAFNFSIYLDDSTTENGCLEVVPRTHKDKNDYSKIIKPPDERISVSAKTNEIIIHDVRLLHGSGFSKSQSLRRCVIIEYNKNQI